MTKNQQQMFLAVTHSDKEELREVYASFSKNKFVAFQKCLREMGSVNGFNFRITGKNAYSFTCGFLYYDEKQQLHCRYYTKKNTYDFIAE